MNPHITSGAAVLVSVVALALAASRPGEKPTAAPQPAGATFSAPPPPPRPSKCKPDGWYADVPKADGCTLVRIDEKPFAKMQCSDRRDGFVVVSTHAIDEKHIVSCELAR